MAKIMEEILGKASIAAGSLVIILVLADAFLGGSTNFPTQNGFNLGIFFGRPWQQASISNLLTVNTRATAIVSIVMTYSLIQLYFRRLRSDQRSMQRKGGFFFVGMAIMLALGLLYGPLSREYGLVATVIQQTVNEGGQYWIGIIFTALIIRGYLVRSREGMLMATVGLLELYGVSNLSSFVLPWLGDLGIWIMRYPALGVNNTLWVTQYIGVITVTGLILIGRQRLRARR